ncbi:hypothetical protein EOL94_03420 [bacterium]|nr:hypothetical protein [bacterium]
MDPKEKSFVVVVLSKKGSNSFKYLKEGEAGQREVYFINHKETGRVTGASMLLGQFIFELESCPDALAFKAGCTNRLYLEDKRVISYEELSVSEKEETLNRLEAMKLGKGVKYFNRINQMIEILNG